MSETTPSRAPATPAGLGEFWLAGLQVLMDDKKDMPLHWAALFVTVAARGKVSIGELATKLDLDPSTTSIAVAGLSKGYRKYDGRDLLRAVPSPEDGRVKLIELTPKGQRVWGRMLERSF